MLSLGEKMCCVSSPVCLCVCLFVLCVCLCVRVEMYLCVRRLHRRGHVRRHPMSVVSVRAIGALVCYHWQRRNKRVPLHVILAVDTQC